VRSRSRRGRKRCREGAERDDRRRLQPSPSTLAPTMILEHGSPGKGMGSSVWSSGWRGEGLGREWRPGEGSGRSRGFYTLAVSSLYVGLSVRDWAVGRCILDGVVGCVYGCGRRCQWLNVPIGKVSGSVGVHERSSSFSSLRSATAQRGH
jgi:hypothetical protein